MVNKQKYKNKNVIPLVLSDQLQLKIFISGFPAMAVYVWSKEEKIRNEVLIAYKDIYFNDQQKPETTALGLIYLIKDCTVAEANSISKIVELIGIPNRARDEIWRFALGRNTERPIPDNTRAASISIIGMLAKVSLIGKNSSYIFHFRILKIIS